MSDVGEFASRVGEDTKHVEGFARQAKEAQDAVLGSEVIRELQEHSRWARSTAFAAFAAAVQLPRKPDIPGTFVAPLPPISRERQDLGARLLLSINRVE